MKLQKQQQGDAIQFVITVPKRYEDDFGWEHQEGFGGSWWRKGG